MKMYKGKATHNEVQGVINELTRYYETHRAIILALLIALAITTIGMSYFATQSVTKALSAECRILLEEQDQRYATECR